MRLLYNQLYRSGVSLLHLFQHGTILQKRLQRFNPLDFEDTETVPLVPRRLVEVRDHAIDMQEQDDLMCTPLEQYIYISDTPYVPYMPSH